jgi:hypothetical protein
MNQQLRNMKKYLAIGLLLLLGQVNAAVLLVNNTSNSPGNYSNIDTAIAAATIGDTIYISGSPYGYGNFTISKSVTIISTGANPQKQLPYTANVGEIAMASNLSNVKVSGLIINGAFAMAPGTNNFDMEYCYFTTKQLQLNSNCNSIKISNCIFINNYYFGKRNIDGFDICSGYYTSCTNLLIQNCIFNGAVAGLNIPGTVIQNNIFIGADPAFYGVNVYNNGGCYATGYIVNATIQNNIFYRADPLQYTSGCAFNNNITYNPSGTFTALPGNGNLDNTNPNFVNFPAAGDLFSWAHNYNLQAASPGNNAGTDGTHIGIYGGTFPVTTSGETYNMPVIRQMNITNTNVPQNGNVNVKVRSTKSRTN